MTFFFKAVFVLRSCCAQAATSLRFHPGTLSWGTTGCFRAYGRADTQGHTDTHAHQVCNTPRAEGGKEPAPHEDKSESCMNLQPATWRERHGGKPNTPPSAHHITRAIASSRKHGRLFLPCALMMEGSTTR